jgi:hypothetical protein
VPAGACRRQARARQGIPAPGGAARRDRCLLRIAAVQDRPLRGRGRARTRLGRLPHPSAAGDVAADRRGLHAEHAGLLRPPRLGTRRDRRERAASQHRLPDIHRFCRLPRPYQERAPTGGSGLKKIQATPDEAQQIIKELQLLWMPPIGSPKMCSQARTSRVGARSLQGTKTWSILQPSSSYEPNSRRSRACCR